MSHRISFEALTVRDVYSFCKGSKQVSLTIIINVDAQATR